MSEIKNGGLGLYGAEHSKCNHMITLLFLYKIMNNKNCMRLNTLQMHRLTHCLGCNYTNA